jgi:hypothetical protein
MNATYYMLLKRDITRSGPGSLIKGIRILEGETFAWS